MIDVASYQLYGPDISKNVSDEHGWEEVFSHLQIASLEISYLADNDNLQCDCLKCASNIKLSTRLGKHYDKWARDSSGLFRDFDETQLLIYPPTIRGYALEKKCWAELLVDNVQIISEEEKINKNAFEKLVFSNKDVKGLIRALVQNHAQVPSEKKEGVPGHLQDLVPGKGQGLVILLHGQYGL